MCEKKISQTPKMHLFSDAFVPPFPSVLHEKTLHFTVFMKFLFHTLLLYIYCICSVFIAKNQQNVLVQHIKYILINIKVTKL